ncbi:ExbD/TolR family protein [Sphingosinicella soli]|uniref:Biopolymer transport protein TolR n=1 Tax=Sphingosinicella soli TaxID=333708 RepID=A0A7W7B3W5_9SPHN|nr:biopolymer transporter ExbD [Sphingosinicella soli]MBB4633551.1 biopolymer transport protein TolR [Sphingosinicella soli]
MAMGLSTGGRRGGKSQPMSEINVTPLVDVMLVLLIIFMIAAPLLVSGVPVDLPDSKAGALKQDNTPVQLSLNAEGELYIDEQLVPAEELGAKLAAISEARAGEAEAPRVYVRADRRLDFGNVMRVMGEVNAAGFKKVALVSEAGAEAR